MFDPNSYIYAPAEDISVARHRKLAKAAQPQVDRTAADPIFAQFAASMRRAAPTSIRHQMTDAKLERILSRFIPRDERRAFSGFHQGRRELRKAMLNGAGVDQIAAREVALNHLGEALHRAGWL